MTIGCALKVLEFLHCMKPRFDQDQPWFFGWTPSEYFSTLPGDAQRRIRLRIASLDDLDRYHELARACPGTRLVEGFVPALSAALGARTAGERDECLELASLVVSYCKPLAEVVLYAPAADAADVLRAYGVRTRVVNVSERRATLYMGYSDAIIDALADCDAALRRKDVTLDERSLVNGILFGYPIGDVFGFCLGIGDTWYPGLVHSPRPHCWSATWSEQVGFRGLKHLADVYRANSPLRLGYRELRIRNGSIALQDSYTLETR